MRITADNRKWWVASAVATASGLVLLDETIVGVALPRIADDLSMSVRGSHWVVSAYLLAFAGLAGVGGRCADLFGVRRIFLTGVLAFGVSSVLAGVAASGAFLIAARFLQGLSAALIFPTGFAIVTRTFPDEEKGQALGLLAAVGTAMLGLGPLLGGVLTSYLSWRFVFLVNVPLVLIAMTCVVVLAPRTPPKEIPSIDFAGFVTLVCGLVLLVLGIMEGPDWGWTSTIAPIVLASGSAFLTLFAVIEWRSANPLVDVRLFSYPSLVGAALVFFTGQLTKIVVVVFVPLFLQHRIGLSPLAAGSMMVAGVVGSPLVSVSAGRVADRIGSRTPALVGLAMTLIGTAVIGFAVMARSEILLIPALLIWGFALPFVFLPAARGVMRAVPHARQGEAAGITVTARLLGGVFGMSGASAVFASVGRYDVVFLATAALMVLVFAFAFVMMEREGALRTA